jgi:tripartite ATP-independent transporter DctM subunit
MTGRHIFLVIGGVGTIAALALWGTGAENMAFSAAFSFIKWYQLLAIPPFIFMGLILAGSGVADKLYDAMGLWFGPVRGGLGVITVVICALFAAMEGLTVAATVTSGTIALPSMLKRNYDKSLAVGVTLSAGTLSIVIPPSIIFILYGVIAHVSIGHLWIAGILPGALMAIFFVVYILVRAKIQPNLAPAIQSASAVTLRRKIIALRDGVAPLVIIFMVLGLLFAGVTTIIECSAIAAVMALGAAALNKKLTINLLISAIDQTFTASCMIMWIFVSALFFAAIYDGLGAVEVIKPMFDSLAAGNPLVMIIFMILTFIIMGAFLDDTAMLLIVAPLYIPLVQDAGFSLVWFGVLYTLTCQIAYITPPFGYNLFILKSVVPKNISLTDIYKASLPFVVLLFVVLLVVLFIPQIATWLPSVYAN